MTTVSTAPPPRLQVDGLAVRTRSGQRVLDGVGFTLAAGERVAVVGASGAGKSVLSLALLSLLRPPLLRSAGSARLDGCDLFDARTRQRHALRGTGVFLVFQSPGSLLDPVLRIGRQLEQVAQRAGLPQAARPGRIGAALDAVALPHAVLQQHALQLSGGMKQRVLIAMALLLQPRLLIADEPTSGLDDDTAQEVLQALALAQRATGATLLLVSHDLRLVQRHADRVLVLHAGRLVEDAPVAGFMAQPTSAAGMALRDAARYLDARLDGRPDERLDKRTDARTDAPA